MTHPVEHLPSLQLIQPRYYLPFLRVSGVHSSAPLVPSYLPWTRPKGVDVSAIYGVQYEALQSIKHGYDPPNLVRHALVQP
ncbi:hypothetical protein N7474_010313 [Penicillium riverlandense]|uniref:uncharacterized protein n=1 Tax=Penicillium riverlandense TaxID=1903569 RepID=UPI002548BBF1|nr:uncharacterized protein N7474_010313 [Penicillium riverlandense]KAJ5806721.1 hypothetical protein N7474_010313 [Penicillium riverlandense]